MLRRLLADHARPVHYKLPLSPGPETNAPTARTLYIHTHRGRAGRSIDDSTERFVEATPVR